MAVWAIASANKNNLFIHDYETRNDFLFCRFFLNKQMQEEDYFGSQQLAQDRDVCASLSQPPEDDFYAMNPNAPFCETVFQTPEIARPASAQ